MISYQKLYFYEFIIQFIKEVEIRATLETKNFEHLYFEYSNIRKNILYIVKISSTYTQIS